MAPEWSEAPATLLLTRCGQPLQRPLAPMGHMSLIGSFTFYGGGLGLIMGWSITGS